jgi:hypothetical protein
MDADMPMTLSDVLVPSTDAAFREIEQEVVILDLASGSYFGLNAVGSRAWALIVEGPRSLQDVHGVLLGEYDVTAEQLERDLVEWATQLVTKGLLRAAA